MSHLSVPPQNLASSTSAFLLQKAYLTSPLGCWGSLIGQSFLVACESIQTSSQENEEILLVQVMDQKADLALDMNGSRGSHDVTRNQSFSIS